MQTGLGLFPGPQSHKCLISCSDTMKPLKPRGGLTPADLSLPSDSGHMQCSLQEAWDYRRAQAPRRPRRQTDLDRSPGDMDSARCGALLGDVLPPEDGSKSSQLRTRAATLLPAHSAKPGRGSCTAKAPLAPKASSPRGHPLTWPQPAAHGGHAHTSSGRPHSWSSSGALPPERRLLTTESLKLERDLPQPCPWLQKHICLLPQAAQGPSGPATKAELPSAIATLDNSGLDTVPSPGGDGQKHQPLPSLQSC